MAHVLVVDDQETNRVTLERILRRESWEVTQAADGQLALDQVRQQPPDVMVTDLKMPGLNGLELLKAVRGHIRTAGQVLWYAHLVPEFLTRPVACIRIAQERRLDD